MDKIEELLTRGVANIIPSKEELEKVLRSGKKIKLYNGIDPTSPHLHLGHMVVLRKLRQFQDLGHGVIVLIGDFTARIGDPADRLSTRHKLTKKQVKENTANYKKMVGRILNLKKSNIRFLHNEEWTNKLKPEDMLELASYFTVSQLLERDMFQERTKIGKEIYVHEFLYPIFQAYDSVSMDVDLEIGGNDQTFNMLAGRTLMKRLKNKEKFVLTMRLLTDPTGKKMGKTEGNIIAFDDTPTEMFGKIMSWPDGMITLGLELLTDVSMHEIQTMDIQKDPVNYKKKLAFEIVKQLNNENVALSAQDNFEKTVQRQELPTDMPVYRYAGHGQENIVDLLIKTKLAPSRSEAKRLVEQGGVEIDQSTINNQQSTINIKDGMIIRVGKRRFLKLVIRN